MGASPAPDRGRGARRCVGLSVAYDDELATVELWVEQGSALHHALCEAFAEWAGYVLADDELHEILGVVPQEGDTYMWGLRPAAHVGRA